MSLYHFKNSKFLIISVCLSILNLALATQVKAHSNEPENQAATNYLQTTPNRSLDMHLLLSRRLGRKIKSQSFESQHNLKISETQEIIPLQNRSLIAKSYRGQASWYGPGFHGRLTANGERYNQNAMTAAHPSLRFGTRVRVTNLNNGRSVVVRINDRGPYAGGRIIDLSAAAARSLNMINSGVAPVSVTILSR